MLSFILLLARKNGKIPIFPFSFFWPLLMLSVDKFLSITELPSTQVANIITKGIKDFRKYFLTFYSLAVHKQP